MPTLDGKCLDVVSFFIQLIMPIIMEYNTNANEQLSVPNGTSNLSLVLLEYIQSLNHKTLDSSFPFRIVSKHQTLYRHKEFLFI